MELNLLIDTITITFAIFSGSKSPMIGLFISYKNMLMAVLYLLTTILYPLYKLILKLVKKKHPNQENRVMPFKL